MKQNKHTKSYYISGMHCPSCKIIIEDTLKEMKGVSNLNVESGKVTLEQNQNFNLNLAKTKLESLGYTLSEKPIKEPISEIFKRILICAIPVFLIIYIMYSLSIPLNSTSVSFSSAIILGLIASTSTCLAVTGGLLLALSTGIRFTSLFLIGRLVSYTILGGLLGLLGGFFSFTSTASAILALTIAILMILLGIAQLGIIKIKSISAISKIPEKLKIQTSLGAFLIGGATFFLPCGFSQSLQLYAITSQSFQTGAIILGLFALGTIPGLLFIGTITTIVKGSLRKYLMTFASLLIITLGILTIPSAITLYNLDKNQDSANTIQNTITQNNLTQTQTQTQNKSTEPQIVSIAVKGYDYEPNQITVKVGVPVKLQVDGTLARGCAKSFVIPSQKINSYLKSGINTYEFTPQKTGTFQFSCSMGMAGPGRIIVTG